MSDYQFKKSDINGWFFMINGEWVFYTHKEIAEMNKLRKEEEPKRTCWYSITSIESEPNE